jgi:hypothetical protein
MTLGGFLASQIKPNNAKAIAMVTTRVKPRGPFYACKHTRTHPRVIVDISAGIPAQDGGCYLAFDSVT